MMSLSSARELAATSIQESQKSYKAQYDKRVKAIHFRLGDWVFVRFPEEETGRKRKLSRPWYGPFRVTAKQDPNLTVAKVYFPEDPPLTIHQLRVCPSPEMLPAGFYWYGAKRRSQGRTPSWLQHMLNVTAVDTATPNPHSGRTISLERAPLDGLTDEDPDHSPMSAEPSVELSTPMDDSEGGPPQTDPPLTGEDEPNPEQVPESVEELQPNNKRYALRDRIHQRQPLRLMEVITRDRDSFGRTG